MNKKLMTGLATGLFLCGLNGLANATGVSIYVDSAPNVYGSPDYPSWETQAFASAANGTFINMANGINTDNIGTTNFEIQDEVVYSFGDLGKRLTWIYWIDGETIENLTGNFEISLLNTWDGDELDFYNDYYGSTWLVPTQWVNYDKDGDGITDGVIGTAGMAWWGAYGVNTQEALDADLAAWGLADESWEFIAKLNGEEFSITSERTSSAPVPEPATMLLFGTGIAGLAGSRFRRKK